MPGFLYRRNGIFYARIKRGDEDVRKSLRTRNRKIAEKRLDRWAQQFETIDGPRYTWKSASGRWTVEYLPSNVSAKSAKRYLSSLHQMVPILADLYIDQIDRKVIAKILKAGKDRGASNSTVRRDLTALSSVLRYCVAIGWCEDNAARSFDRSVIRERRDPIMLPTDAEIAAVINTAPGQFATMIDIARLTGMRQEEMASLEWRAVNLDRGEILLRKTKGNRARIIPLGDPILYAAWGTLRGTPRHIKEPFVFWHDDGSRYHNVSSRFGEMRTRAGVRFRFHDLRHKFAVDYLQETGDIYRLSTILGHRSVKTTEIYLDYVDRDGAQKGAQWRRSGTVEKV